jgi:CRISPR-associated protein Csm3
MKKIFQRNITGTIHLLSGMRIGGSDDLLQIGGTDLTCIKHPGTLLPYIPGSSIKGKLRSELEKKHGRFGGGQERNRPCDCAEPKCEVCRLFGPHRNEHNLGPTRIIVRDAPPDGDVRIEIKSSTAIDRRMGTALRGSLRSEERVAAGARFKLKVGIQVFEVDDEWSKDGKSGADELIAFVKEAMREMQNTGLGSGISKGSGEIELVDLKLDGQPFSL